MKDVQIDSVALRNWEQFIDDVTDIPSQEVRQERLPVTAGAYSLPLAAKLKDRMPDWVLEKVSDSISCTLNLTVGVPEKQRGVHLSRLAEISVASSDGKDWPSIGHLAAHLANEAAVLQGSSTAKAELQGHLDFFVDTPISGRRSLERISLSARAIVDEGSIDSVNVSATAAIMTACPCTLTFTKYQRAAWLTQQLGDFVTANNSLMLPSYTHSQRANAQAFIESKEATDCIYILLDSLEETCRLTRTVLKRPDEHSVVKDAHSKPKFTEDVVREITLALSRKSEAKFSENLLRVGSSCNAIESIHGHNAFAESEQKYH